MRHFLPSSCFSSPAGSKASYTAIFSKASGLWRKSSQTLR